MDVGVGLPSMIPRAEGSAVVEWARRADAGPFASVATLERLTYDGYDPLPVLGAAAAVTRRIELATMIVAAPLRPAAILAKEAATIAALSGGRFTLGVGLGAREEDYTTAGSDFATRGARFADELAEIRTVWEEEQVGPSAAKLPRLLVGGDSGPAFARGARYADGYAHGGGPPRAFARWAGQALSAWSDLGRPGRPALWGQGYFALGREEEGADYLRHYYAFTGPFAEKVAAANLTSTQAIRDFVRGYDEAGCDHLVLFPTVADLEQLDRLADVLG